MFSSCFQAVFVAFLSCFRGIFVFLLGRFCGVFKCVCFVVFSSNFVVFLITFYGVSNCLRGVCAVSVLRAHLGKKCKLALFSSGAEEDVVDPPPPASLVNPMQAKFSKPFSLDGDMHEIVSTLDVSNLRCCLGDCTNSPTNITVTVTVLKSTRV